MKTLRRDLLWLQRTPQRQSWTILSSWFLPRVSVTVLLRVLGFVSDFRGFGCSVSLVHFLFYFEGFLSCFALIGHDCFQLPWWVSMITGGISGVFVSNKQLWLAACFRFSSFQRVFAQRCSLPLFQLLEGLDKQAQTETRRPRWSLEVADFFHFFWSFLVKRWKRKCQTLFEPDEINRVH